MSQLEKRDGHNLKKAYFCSVFYYFCFLDLLFAYQFAVYVLFYIFICAMEMKLFFPFVFKLLESVSTGQNKKCSYSIYRTGKKSVLLSLFILIFCSLHLFCPASFFSLFSKFSSCFYKEKTWRFSIALCLCANKNPFK